MGQLRRMIEDSQRSGGRLPTSGEYIDSFNTGRVNSGQNSEVARV